MTSEAIFKFLQSGGLLGGFLLVVVTGQRGLWVFKATVDALMAGKDRELAGKDAVIAELRSQLVDEQERGSRYEAMALRLLDATQEAALVAKEAVRRR